MPDYVRAVATAQRMIKAAGRSIGFQGAATVPASDLDPLAGPGVAPAIVPDVPAVFVQPSSLQALGMTTAVVGFFRNSTAIAMIAADGVNDFTTFKFVIDSDNSRWKIDHVEKLQPGEIVILYFVGMSRK